MLDKLEMFIAVAKEAHFGRAAESLGITQPSLSAGVRQLEKRALDRLKASIERRRDYAEA